MIESGWYGNIHIYAPKASIKRISAGHCPDCGKWTRFLSFFTEWHGWDSTCLRCGREWHDGEWATLAFSRFARRDNIEAAKKRYRRMS